MTAQVWNDFGSREEWHEESPCTTSSDDLFADINWPSDEVDSPLDDDQSSSARSNERDCESPKNSIHHSPTFSNMSGSHSPAENPMATPSAANGPSKSSGGSRFSKEVKSTLRTWFNEHKDNPYPTAEEKNELAVKTGLKHGQISLWLVNTRRRYRSRKHGRSTTLPDSMLPLSAMDAAPELNHFPIASAPMAPPQRPYEEMNPMDRWKYVTPLEQEPALPTVILGTVANAPPLNFDPYNVHNGHHLDSDLQSSALLSNNDYPWARSMASYETGLTSLVTGSTISDSTLFSYPSTFNEQHDRRRRRGNPTRKVPKSTNNSSKEKDRFFQCTFCASNFATKHDWARHEKSQHLTLESWTCCLTGGTISNDCAFCDTSNPSSQHLERHNFSECQEKDVGERTFYRKDHFMQHLRLVHGCKFRSRMESWKSEISEIKSRCGFCNATFGTWSQRTDHLATHFKCRADMRDWKGDWGFEAHVLALVEIVGLDMRGGLEATATPPPMLPSKGLGGAGLGPGGSPGVSGGTYGFQPPPLTSEEIDSILAMSAGMGDETINAVYLGLNN